jgi:photosystem II stability/assembly factor-like uncharacterized protein
VYAATHEEGLLKTTDAGATWEVLGFPKNIINAVILHPMDPDLLFVAGDSGLYKSNDAGGKFEKIGGNLPSSTEVLGLAVNAKDVNVVYVALGKAGIRRSVDGGRSFHAWMNGIPDWEIADWGRLCVSPANPATMYAEPNAVGAERMPYWSSDGGATWNPVVFRERGFFDSPGSTAGHWFLEPIVAHPTEPNVAFQTGGSTRKTTDGGRTWISAAYSRRTAETLSPTAFRRLNTSSMTSAAPRQCASERTTRRRAQGNVLAPWADGHGSSSASAKTIV